MPHFLSEWLRRQPLEMALLIEMKSARTEREEGRLAPGDAVFTLRVFGEVSRGGRLHTEGVSRLCVGCTKYPL